MIIVFGIIIHRFFKFIKGNYEVLNMPLRGVGERIVGAAVQRRSQKLSSIRVDFSRTRFTRDPRWLGRHLAEDGRRAC